MTETPKPQRNRFFCGIGSVIAIATLIIIWSYAPNHPNTGDRFYDGVMATILSIVIIVCLAECLLEGLGRQISRPEE
jgi:hypothetical protein